MAYKFEKDNKRQKQKIKSYEAARRPYPVHRGNWAYQEGEQAPTCTIHGERAIWHHNRARSAGGQWICSTCGRNKSRGQRREWKTHHINPLEYNLKRAFTAAKYDSKKTGREFSISFDKIMALWESQGGYCAVSGDKMEYIPGDGFRRRNKVTMDRIDSTQGYVLGNIRLVCDWVNRAKSDLSKDELRRFVKGMLATDLS